MKQPSTWQANSSTSLQSAFIFHHFPQLDGLRGLAILFVLVGHVLEFGFGIRTDFGGLGVLLFFVLSGFLITGLLDREKAKTSEISLRAFYIRRILRLFPALFVYLAVLCVLIRTKVVSDTPWYAVLACLVYVRNIWGRGSTTGHIWSLSLEEQFYSIWPWVMKAFNRAIAMRVAFIAAGAISVFRMVAIRFQWFSYGNGVFYERPWFRFDSILFGCGIALLVCNSSSVNWFRAYISRRAIPLITWPSVLAWSVWGESLTHVGYLTIQALLASLLLLHLVISRESSYLRVFSHPIATWVGRLSYALYLWQQFLTVQKYPSWGGLRVFPINILLSFVLAAASYFLVERPFLSLKNRFSRVQS